ncbi:Chromatin modification- protein meaf6 [Apophysomyces ossiformis]|uniref:Chromatin modification-related protein EAF6 n=1 Tax=Apophysomyces ossiformis TaxID=679940 RepID=A0A8H7C0X8_9FUNG|nr:Chromatin modification- protein meaf6 [Apophysomyces ossiformis]
MPEIIAQANDASKSTEQPAATAPSTPANEDATDLTVTKQKYEEAKMELQALLARKKQVDNNLINLEHSIYLFEGSYLEDTQHNGNIIRGFDGYLTNRTDRRKQKFTELDRLFSLSSSTYQKAIALKEEKDQESSQDDRPSSGLMRRDKKRKLKTGNDLSRKRNNSGSAGRDTDEESET